MEIIRLAYSFAIQIGWRWWLASLTVGVAAGALYYRLTRNEGFYRIRLVAVVLLTMYVILVLAFTVLSRLRRGIVIDMPININIYGTILSRLNANYRYELVLNLALLMPLGLLFPVATGRGIVGTVVFGIGLSAFIESLQLILKVGTCELSDVVLNSLGACMGYGLMLVIANVVNNRHTWRGERCVV